MALPSQPPKTEKGKGVIEIIWVLPDISRARRVSSRGWKLAAYFWWANLDVRSWIRKGTPCVIYGTKHGEKGGLKKKNLQRKFSSGKKRIFVHKSLSWFCRIKNIHVFSSGARRKTFVASNLPKKRARVGFGREKIIRQETKGAGGGSTQHTAAEADI